SQPVAGRTMALAAREEVRTQEISSTPAESEPCMWGRATLITGTSRTCITGTVMTVTVMAQRRRAPSGAPRAGGGKASAVLVVIWGPLREHPRQVPTSDQHLADPARALGRGQFAPFV